MKVKLKYIGNHQPQEEVWVEESLVEGLLKTGAYVLEGQAKPESKKLLKDMKEKELKKWIVDNKIDIKYDIVNDTKEDILLRLKERDILEFRNLVER